jgi:hypothetical protein
MADAGMMVGGAGLPQGARRHNADALVAQQHTPMRTDLDKHFNFIALLHVRTACFDLPVA